MKILKLSAALIFGIIIGYFLFHKEDSNARSEYSSDGLPKNCRALIYESEADFHIYKKFSNEELLQSIFRNCGEKRKFMEE